MVEAGYMFVQFSQVFLLLIKANIFIPTRFSDTRCLVSERKISRGEEITINYGYNLKSPNIPRWYRKLYRETYGETEDNKLEEDPQGENSEWYRRLSLVRARLDGWVKL